MQIKSDFENFKNYISGNAFPTDNQIFFIEINHFNFLFKKHLNLLLKVDLENKLIRIIIQKRISHKEEILMKFVLDYMSNKILNLFSEI